MKFSTEVLHKFLIYFQYFAEFLNTVDIGLAQLAMHSSYETAGTLDVDYMIQALTVYYSTAIQAEEDGVYQLH